ncbi:sugar phosphate nucleotidyltransferase [Halanaerobium hydrogeniformans]|uniref:Nucleotidyl transferase domain-containing protein n=1 Tax=Halanaerobium hydrogeniformans TaxID=656519 RepID=E4RNK5_HALHG|nr:sugar phosphate nucleotidyltransferase [Halanaerobium hydrogeniformans]ADQ13540.1 hypothetical protein Halsa_0040 [Halanaerobium hydrogeniformans]
MQALILNSGLGRRMGELTDKKPKCMVEINNNQTILSRQLDILRDNYITDIVITTGPYESEIKKLIKKNYENLNIQLINNNKYDKTNYIYSMYLAKEIISERADVLLLHGDLVFNDKILKKINSAVFDNFVLINKNKKNPSKDFKAIIEDYNVKKIDVNLEGNNAFSLQPFYKFKYNDFKVWLNEIGNFIMNGENKVYAEKALNQVLNKKIELKYVDIGSLLCMEVDNKEDLKRVQEILNKD